MYPTEVIFLDVKPDYYPINADYAGLAKKENSQTVRLFGRNNKDVLQYILKALGETVNYGFNPQMRISDLTSRNKNIVLFFEGKIFPALSITSVSSWEKTKHFRAR